MSEQRTKNNYRYKRTKKGCRADCSGCLQKISKIVSKRRRVEFQSNHSVHGMKNYSNTNMIEKKYLNCK